MYTVCLQLLRLLLFWVFLLRLRFFLCDQVTASKFGDTEIQKIRYVTHTSQATHKDIHKTTKVSAPFHRYFSTLRFDFEHRTSSYCPRLGANSPLPEELAYFDHAALYWYLTPSGRPAAGVRWGGAAAAAIGAAAIGAAAGTGPALVLHSGTSCLASHAALAASAPGGTTAATAGRAAVTGARTIDCFGRMAAALSPIEGVRLGERPAVKLRRKSMMTHWLKQSRLKGVRSFKMMRDFGGAKRRKTQECLVSL